MNSVPNLEYPEIAKVLSEASGVQIPASAFQRLESPIGSVDKKVNLVDCALVGNSDADNGRYFVECTLTLRSSPIDNLVSQRTVYDKTPPREVVRVALCQLVYSCLGLYPVACYDNNL